jgi:hypothetical protein
MTLPALLDVARQPILPEAKHALRASWESLPAAFRAGEQMFGRQGNPDAGQWRSSVPAARPRPRACP